MKNRWRRKNWAVDHQLHYGRKGEDLKLRLMIHFLRRSLQPGTLSYEDKEDDGLRPSKLNWPKQSSPNRLKWVSAQVDYSHPSQDSVFSILFDDFETIFLLESPLMRVKGLD